MSFDPMSFFQGFARYLREQRSQALVFLAANASIEHWLQFEAAAWLNENRPIVGLDNGRWSIWLESKKTDTWLVNARTGSTVGIEFKCVHNNKNCCRKVWELRRDLSDAKRRPDSYRKETHVQIAIAALIYLRYKHGQEYGYQTLGGVVKNPWTATRFVDFVRTECCSMSDEYGVLPALQCLGVSPIVEWRNGEHDQAVDLSNVSLTMMNA